MATGGSDVTADLSGGHDEADLSGGHDEACDWACDQCEADGQATEASAYCRDCREAYCDPCLKLHARFPAMRKHVVLGDAQKDSWGEAAVRGPDQTCPEHDGQPISMYCGGHDFVCCPVCAALDHKECEDMFYIPKISKGISKSQEFLKTQNDVSTTIAETNKTIDEAKQGQDVLDETRQSAIDEIRGVKCQVVDAFEKLEDKAISEVDKLYDDLKTESVKITNECEDACKGLEQLGHQLNPTQSVGDSELFVRMKLSQKKIVECQLVGQELSNGMATEQFKIVFNANPALQSVKSIASIGQAKRGCPKSRLYKFHEAHECVVDMDSEKSYTTVCGIFQLPNGNIILSDQPNKSLKLLSSKYTMIDRCVVPGRPSQICCTNKSIPTEVVVALIDSGSLQFLSVDDKIKLTRRVSLKHTCNGIVYCNGKFYISDASKKVYIYTVSGKRVTLVQTVASHNGQALFSDCQDISLSCIGYRKAVDTLFIADGEKGIVNIDVDGRYLQTIDVSIAGACFKAIPDNRGNIFVINGDRCVIQLGENGKTVLGTIEKNAKQMFFDANTSVLYVWCWDKHRASVQHLKLFKP